MKGVFLVFHGFAAHNGISKKIFAQLEALRRMGADTSLCYLSIDAQGHRKRMMGEQVLEDYGAGLSGKIRKRTSYRALGEYIRREGIDFIYMRSDHNANPVLSRWLAQQHQAGVRILMEIPTYPYDCEYTRSPLKRKMSLWTDRLFRHGMARHIDRMVTFSDRERIFGVPTLRISNGIDFSLIPLKSATRDTSADASDKIQGDTSAEVHLTGVADIHFWHGFDRVIEGLAAYEKAGNGRPVYFHVVGSGVPAELALLRELTQRHDLQDRVIFHGPLSGQALDEAFEKADFGIASLGRHRNGITRIKTLKNREYAARGIPFVYSETDEDFDDMPYVLKAPADETPLDIAALLAFLDACRLSPAEIRGSIEGTLSWDVQMGKVLHEIETLKPAEQ